MFQIVKLTTIASLIVICLLASISFSASYDTLADRVAGELLPPQFEGELTRARNQVILDDLNQSVVHERPGRISMVGPELRLSIFDSILNHEVAGMSQLPKYDPTGALGLCWGRAMAVHIESLRKGVNKEAIRKVWTIGAMRGPNFNWSYHVAIALRGDDLRWYVLDPFFFEIMTVEAWYRRLLNTNSDRNISFYVTSASRYSRANADKYDKELLSQDAYTNGFFTKLLESFRAKSKELADKNRSQN